MRPKSLAILLLAIGCGLVAMVGVTEVMSRRNLPEGMIGDTQSIFVAVQDIPLGDPIATSVVKLEQWPKDKVPAGALSRIEDVENRRVRTKIYAGEPISEHRLLGKGASAQGATALIPKGYRAVPVKVDLVSGGGSMILPGDRVDVMVHMKRDPTLQIPETITQTILQDIKVFAVDDVVDLEKEKDPNRKSIQAKTISLLLTPQQSAMVMMAARMGDINLVMRSPEDDQQTANAEARPGDLFAGGRKSDRSKDSSLLTPGDSDIGEKTKGFVDFLNSMKQKTTGIAATPAPDAAPARPTWIMRMLKPGEVNDLQFEKQDGAAGPPGSEWRLTGMDGGFASAPPKDEHKIIAPPARDSAGPPPPPKQEPKKGKT